MNHTLMIIAAVSCFLLYLLFLGWMTVEARKAEPTPAPEACQCYGTQEQWVELHSSEAQCLHNLDVCYEDLDAAAEIFEVMTW